MMWKMSHRFSFHSEIGNPGPVKEFQFKLNVPYFVTASQKPRLMAGLRPHPSQPSRWGRGGHAANRLLTHQELRQTWQPMRAGAFLFFSCGFYWNYLSSQLRHPNSKPIMMFCQFWWTKSKVHPISCFYSISKVVSQPEWNSVPCSPPYHKLYSFFAQSVFLCSSVNVTEICLLSIKLKEPIYL